jgi:hypothetical protein
MLFGVVILVFLLMVSFLLLVNALTQRTLKPLLILVLIWGVPAGLWSIINFVDEMQRPIRLTKNDIIGEYHIDTTFYPGVNARWQYKHYVIQITKDSLLLLCLNDSGKPMAVFRNKIKYTYGPPDKWEIDGTPGHHIITHHPTLYRSHTRFYYVFHSTRFGNMFFRKVEVD